MDFSIDASNSSCLLEEVCSIPASDTGSLNLSLVKNLEEGKAVVFIVCFWNHSQAVESWKWGLVKILGIEELAWFIYFAGNTPPLLRPGKCLLRCIAFFPTSVPSHPPLLIPIPDFPLCSTPSAPPSPGSDNSCWNNHISISFLFLTNVSASWICFYLQFWCYEGWCLHPVCWLS